MAGEVHHPVRVPAVKVAVAIDHFGLDPQAKVHAEGVHPIDQRLEAVREFHRIDGPVAKPGMGVVAGAEPAVIDDEALDADSRRLVGERHLARFGDIEPGRFPAVVDHRAEPPRPLRQDVRELETVECARCAAHALVRIAGVEDRRVERLARAELPAEIVRIVAACALDLAEHVAADRNLPGAAPRQRAEPDRAMLLIRLAGAIDREPGVMLVAAHAAAAFQNGQRLGHRLGLQRELAGIAAGQVGNAIVWLVGEREHRRRDALDGEPCRAGVADLGRPRDDAAVRVDRVAERHVDRPVGVGQLDRQRLPVDPVGAKAEPEIAVAVGKADLEAGIADQAGPLPGIFLRSQCRRQVEAGKAVDVRDRKGFVLAQLTAPIKGPQPLVGIDPEDIGDAAAV